MTTSLILPEAFVKRDIVVVGASAGGVEALRTLVGGLPADFPGAILVVLHIPPWAASEMAPILSRSGPLPAIEPAARQKIEPGHIYVAPPDFHLIVEEDHVVRWKGPAEDHHRPSINTLFRSAAVGYRERVTGVVLSGTLDDGTAGLWWIHRFGGVSIVQDPEEAPFPDMPRSALQHVAIDYVLGVSAMGPFLSQLVNRNGHPTPIEALAAQEQRKWKST